MKKIFAIALTLCMLTSLLCVSTLTASAAGDELAIGLFGKDDKGTYRPIGIYDSFEEAWNDVADYSTNLDKAWEDARQIDEDDTKEGKIVSLHVEVYSDWYADGNGVFGSGIGFKDGSIYVPGDSKISLNLLGHSINSGNAEGTALYIDADADIEIIGGTIVGGIYADNSAKVGIWNVYVTGNTVNNGSSSARAASIFGEGSFAMIVALVALVVSVICLVLIVDIKKKLVPAVANNTAETEDQE